MISPCEAHPLPTRACLFVSRRADGPAMGTPGRLPGYGHAGPTARLWARHMPYELVLLCSCLIVDITCDTSALLFAVACLLKLCAVAATPETALRPSRLVRRASHLPSPFSSSSRPGCWHPYVFERPDTQSFVTCGVGDSIALFNVWLCACSVTCLLEHLFWFARTPCVVILCSYLCDPRH